VTHAPACPINKARIQTHTQNT